jgi:Reverse transcriptase (RNA-dependent DNA polymerase)
MTLKSMGYMHTNADHTVFTCIKDGILSIIALYINDITMACKDIKVINQDKEMLKRTYEMTDLGEITWILGIHITCDCNTGWIALSQEKYINNTLNHFGKTNVRPISTPTTPNEHLLKLNSPETKIKILTHLLPSTLTTNPPCPSLRTPNSTITPSTSMSGIVFFSSKLI